MERVPKKYQNVSQACESFWHLEQSYLLYISMKDPDEKLKSVQNKRRSMLNLNPKLEKIVINPRLEAEAMYHYTAIVLNVNDC
jgi:hypothetical protein